MCERGGGERERGREGREGEGESKIERELFGSFAVGFALILAELPQWFGAQGLDFRGLGLRFRLRA